MSPMHQFRASDIIKAGRVSQETFDDLKQWTIAQPLPPLSEQQLILFLISCNNELSQAKNTIKTYFQCRAKAPELFKDRNVDSEDVHKTLETCAYSILPVRTSDNHAIVTWKMIQTEYYKFHVHSVAKILLMTSEMTSYMTSYKDPPDGFLWIIDMTGFGLMHLTRLRIGILFKFFQYIQEGIPVKLKCIHILNTVYFIDKLMKIVRPLMKEELYKKLVFHSVGMDMQEFFEKHLPAECVPEDYGGKLPKIEVLSEETYKKMRDMKTFFREEEEQDEAYTDITNEINKKHI